MTILEVLKLPLEQRLKLTGTKQITSFKLDDKTYTGYKGYSFFWELTLASQPERSAGGVIDLTSNAYFITPHLRIDFSLISYQDFMQLRQQQLSKLYFNLTCFDTDFNRTITEEVYFHPDTLPNFVTMARKLNGEKWIEILGAKDYTIELVGTNRLVEKKTIKYNLNRPTNASWGGDYQVEKEFAKNTTVGVGDNAFIWNGEYENDEKVLQRISEITFGDKYRFVKWSAYPDGSGFGYVDGDEYFLRNDTILYAIWKESA